MVLKVGLICLKKCTWYHTHTHTRTHTHTCWMELLIKLWFTTGIKQHASASDGWAAGYFSTFCMQRFWRNIFGTLGPQVAIGSWSALHYPDNWPLNLLPISGILFDHFLEVRIKFLDIVCQWVEPIIVTILSIADACFHCSVLSSFRFMLEVKVAHNGFYDLHYC